MSVKGMTYAESEIVVNGKATRVAVDFREQWIRFEQPDGEVTKVGFKRILEWYAEPAEE